MSQLDLPIFQAQQDADQVRLLEDILRSNSDWMTSAAILVRMGLKVDENTRRDLRRLASKTANIISGTRGYRHMDHATTDEITHAVATLESQAKEMLSRATRIRHQAHSRLG